MRVFITAMVFLLPYTGLCQSLNDDINRLSNAEGRHQIANLLYSRQQRIEIKVREIAYSQTKSSEPVSIHQNTGIIKNNEYINLPVSAVVITTVIGVTEGARAHHFNALKLRGFPEKDNTTLIQLLPSGHNTNVETNQLLDELIKEEGFGFWLNPTRDGFESLSDYDLSKFIDANHRLKDRAHLEWFASFIDHFSPQGRRVFLHYLAEISTANYRYRLSDDITQEEITSFKQSVSKYFLSKQGRKEIEQ